MTYERLGLQPQGPPLPTHPHSTLPTTAYPSPLREEAQSAPTQPRDQFLSAA